MSGHNYARSLAAALTDEKKARKLLAQIDREDCATLAGFVNLAWPILEPSASMKWGNAMDVICDHLEAVTRGDIKRLLINVPPGMMKPVHIDEPVLERTLGRINLAEVREGDEVLTHRGRFRKVLAVHEQGTLPLLKIITSKGRVVRTAPDHPFLTPTGWVQAMHLRHGSVLAAVIPQEPCGQRTVSPQEARLLGYLIGDGCTKYAQITVTNPDPGVIADVHACAAHLGFVTWEKMRPGCTTHAVVIKSVEGRWTGAGPSPLRLWLQRHGLDGKCSYTKCVPPEILSANEEILGEFIAAYWSCDGTVIPRKETGQPRVCADTVNRDLAEGIQHILLRLGMRASVYKKTAKLESKRQGSLYTSYTITVAGADSIKFAERIPWTHSKRGGALKDATLAEFPRVLAEDEVMSVEPDGEGRCRCLTVEEDASFTARDLAVHNSLLTAAFWPMWEWGPKGSPEKRFLSFSYADRLSIRDNRRCRILADSEWFQERWPLKIVSDQNQKTLFENERRGFRMASSVGGVGTGARADRVIVDDPHHVADGDSPAKLESTLLWFNETLPTRLNDPEHSTIVVIMQRVHESDVSGEIIRRELGYEHLMLPMRYEPDRHCTTSIGFSDWRTKEGELLFPARFPLEVIERDEKVMGSYASAAQFQQRPAPRGGGMLKVERMEVVRDWPREARSVRVWDTAATEEGKGGDPDYTVGLKMAELEGRFWITDVVRGRWSPDDVERMMRQTAMRDGIDVAIHLKREPGSSGKAIIEHYMRRTLLGFEVYEEPDTGSKVLRSRPFAASVEAGNVRLVQGAWVEEFLAEARVFPVGAHDDQVDCAADAWLKLAQGEGVALVA